tara:strand:+ start:3495 stop:4145 length:651 start_codon:yes stop_codon:yes gene_type:complete
MRYRPLPPLEELKEFLDYNPDTGIFTWIKSRGRNSSVVGKEAGHKQKFERDTRIRISVNGKLYFAHRLAYYIYHGVDPLEKEVDHKDRNPLNNKIDNLRLATKKENCRNSSMSKNNTSGVTGVHWHKVKKKWEATITEGKKKYLGIFTNKEDAIKARKEAEIKYYGEFRSREPEKEKSICWLGVIPEGMKDEMRYPTEEEIDKFLEEAENDEQTTN